MNSPVSGPDPLTTNGRKGSTATQSRLSFNAAGGSAKDATGRSLAEPQQTTNPRKGSASKQNGPSLNAQDADAKDPAKGSIVEPPGDGGRRKNSASKQNRLSLNNQQASVKGATRDSMQGTPGTAPNTIKETPGTAPNTMKETPGIVLNLPPTGRKSMNTNKPKAKSYFSQEEAMRRGSNYFGVVENTLLFGSDTTQAYSKSFMEESVDHQPELEERDSFIVFSDAGSKPSETDIDSSPLHYSDPTSSSDNPSLVPNTSFPRHNLKATPSDLFNLKKRFLYPGIWEEDSEEEPDKATSINRRPPRKKEDLSRVKKLSDPMQLPVFKPIDWRDLTDESEGCAAKSTSSIITLVDAPPKAEKRSSSGQVSFKSDAPGGSSGSLRKRSMQKDGPDREKRKRTLFTCRIQKAVLKDPDTVEKSSSTGKKSESRSRPPPDFVSIFKKKEKEHKEVAHEEALTLLEKICILREEAKYPMTLKERFLGHRPIYGFPGCFDKTEGFPQCLKPGELVRLAMSTHKLWRIPENAALTREQFVLLMKNIETFDRNDYICLIYAMPENHPDFNPYKFKILPYYQVPPKTGYYSLSKYGFLHIFNGIAEYTSMVQFKTQMLIYDHIMKIHFFAKFRLWKAFNLWRLKIRGRKMAAFKASLFENLFINHGPLQLVLRELMKMCDKMSHMGFLKLSSTITYSLEEFMNFETRHVGDVLDKLKVFEGMVEEMINAACRATLMEDGFSQDSYLEEMEFYQKYMEAPVVEMNKPFNKAQYPGQWLTYSQQTRKKHICRKLTRFIRLVDYYVQHTYYQIMKNSIVYLMLEMHKRVEYIPEDYQLPIPYEDAMEELVREHEKYGGRMILSAGTEPIFEIGLTWAPDRITPSPNVTDFIRALRFLCYNWKKTIMGYENMVKREIFNPYTQPIINGYADKKTCGDGPNMKFIFQNDSHILGVADVIQSIILHGFEICDAYTSQLEYIQLFCLENERIEVEITNHPVNVGEYLQLNERFEEQYSTVVQLADTQSLGIFQMNNIALKEHAHILLSRCTEELRKYTPTDEEVFEWEKGVQARLAAKRARELAAELCEEEGEECEEVCSEDVDCEEEMCLEEEDCEFEEVEAIDWNEGKYRCNEWLGEYEEWRGECDEGNEQNEAHGNEEEGSKEEEMYSGEAGDEKKIDKENAAKPEEEARKNKEAEKRQRKEGRQGDAGEGPKKGRRHHHRRGHKGEGRDWEKQEEGSKEAETRGDEKEKSDESKEAENVDEEEEKTAEDIETERENREKAERRIKNKLAGEGKEAENKEKEDEKEEQTVEEKEAEIQADDQTAELAERRIMSRLAEERRDAGKEAAVNELKEAIISSALG